MENESQDNIDDANPTLVSTVEYLIYMFVSRESNPSI